MRRRFRADRRIAPGKILVVELDEGQVVRLEIGDPVARLAADDVLRIDADDVAGADQLESVRSRARRSTPSLAVAETRTVARERNVPARESRSRCRAAARAERNSAACHHAANSNSETTCSLPLSSGLPATTDFIAWTAAASLRKTVVVVQLQIVGVGDHEAAGAHADRRRAEPGRDKPLLAERRHRHCAAAQQDVEDEPADTMDTAAGAACAGRSPHARRRCCARSPLAARRSIAPRRRPRTARTSGATVSRHRSCR